MDLHANAALSLNKRRVLARRVVEQGWSLGDETEDITLALKLADERLYADKGRRQTVASAVAG